MENHPYNEATTTCSSTKNLISFYGKYCEDIESLFKTDANKYLQYVKDQNIELLFGKKSFIKNFVVLVENLDKSSLLYGLHEDVSHDESNSKEYVQPDFENFMQKNKILSESFFGYLHTKYSKL